MSLQPGSRLGAYDTTATEVAGTEGAPTLFWSRDDPGRRSERRPTFNWTVDPL